MRYIADLLTFMRLQLAFAVPVSMLQDEWTHALILFTLGVLSDALDGWFARRWPYSSEQEARLPWRRIDHHMLDNGPDTLLVGLSLLVLMFIVPGWWLVTVVVGVVSALFFAAVQAFIHNGNAKAAELTDVVFGYWFALSIGAVVVQIAYRADLLMPTLAIGLGALAVLLPLKWERVVSRPETRAAAMKYAK